MFITHLKSLLSLQAVVMKQGINFILTSSEINKDFFGVTSSAKSQVCIAKSERIKKNPGRIRFASEKIVSQVCQ